jgi:hypothetical protein
MVVPICLLAILLSEQLCEVDAQLDGLVEVVKNFGLRLGADLAALFQKDLDTCSHTAYLACLDENGIGELRYATRSLLGYTERRLNLNVGICGTHTMDFQ